MPVKGKERQTSQSEVQLREDLSGSLLSSSSRAAVALMVQKNVCDMVTSLLKDLHNSHGNPEIKSA